MFNNQLIEYVVNNFHIFSRESRWIGYFKLQNRIIELESDEANKLLTIQKHLQSEGKKSFTPNDLSVINQLISLLGYTDENYRVATLREISTFYLKFNNLCNLCCEYCNITNSTNELRLLAETTALKSVKVLSKLGAKGVGIHGGEPLLHFEQLKKVISAIRKFYPEFYIGLTCNGTLITEEIADFLQKNNILVSVEIDGGEQEHNKIKKYKNGAGSFANAIHGADILYKKGVLVALETTVTAKQDFDLCGILSLQDRYFGVPITVSRAKGIGADKKACVHHGHELFNFLKQGLEFGMQESCVFTDALAHLINLASLPIESKYICNCILDKVSVDIDGNVYVCPKIERAETLIGNINDKDFIRKFNINRSTAASYFSALKANLPWYSNLLEICIDSLYEGNDQKWYLQDNSILEKYFEDLIFYSLNNDTDILIQKWNKSGF